MNQPRNHNDDTRSGLLGFVFSLWGLAYLASVVALLLWLFDPEPAGYVGAQEVEVAMDTSWFSQPALYVGGIIGIMLGLMGRWMVRTIKRILGHTDDHPGIKP